MSVHTYKIEILNSGGAATATQLFQDIRGAVDNDRQRTELLARLGVDGVGIRELGSRGEPFTIETIEHRDSFASATAAIAAYQAYIGSGAPYGVRLTQHSVTQGVYGVLDVRPSRPVRAIAAVAGSLIANPQVELRMVWTLVNQEVAP